MNIRNATKRKHQSAFYLLQIGLVITLIGTIGIGTAIKAEGFSRVSSSSDPSASLNSNDGNIVLKKFVNTDFGFTIEYPNGWKKEVGKIDPTSRTVFPVSFTAPFENKKDHWRENVAVGIDNIQYTEDLAQYLKDIVSDYQGQFKNFHLIDSSVDSTFAGSPAYSLTYTHKWAEKGYYPVNLQTYEIGTIIGDTAYFITFEADKNSFDEYLPTIQMILDSFSLDDNIVSVDDTDNTGQQATISEHSQGASKSNIGFIQYSNSHLGVINMEYPKDWTVDENESTVEFVSPEINSDGSHALFYIDGYDGENKPLEEHVATEMRSLYGSTDYTVVDSKPIKLRAGQPAQVIVYKYYDQESAGSFMGMETLALKDNSLYIITFFVEEASYPRYLPVALNMMKSLDLGSDSSEAQQVSEEQQPPAYLNPA